MARTTFMVTNEADLTAIRAIEPTGVDVTANTAYTIDISAGTWLRVARNLLRGWQELMRSRRQLRNLCCELDDHILQDIGITRAALRWEAEKPFWG
jgi:uncharacterized protein YjiS (DUF1127 family)